MYADTALQILHIQRQTIRCKFKDLVIGKSYNFDFAESELRREIETALLRNEDIYSMSGFSAEKVGATLKISFTLNTAYGESAEVYTT